jgi:hypothetical protein
MMRIRRNSRNWSTVRTGSAILREGRTYTRRIASRTGIRLVPNASATERSVSSEPGLNEPGHDRIFQLAIDPIIERLAFDRDCRYQIYVEVRARHAQFYD